MAGKDERAIFALEKILEDESVLSWQFTDGMCALIAKFPDRKVVRHFAEKYPLKFAGALVPYIFDGSEDPDLILEWLGARRAEWVTLQEIEKEKNGKARLPFPDTNPWDPSYFQALGRRPRFLEETKGERFREVTARIGELADRPERAAYWGWVLDRKGEPQAGVPFLELGMRSKDEQIAACAAFTLMEVRAKLGEWEKAELLLPAASKDLTLREKKDWFGRIAEGARKAGASDVAERCERKLKNLGRY